MLKLIKYELIRSKISKLIMAGIFLVLEVIFAAGVIMGNEEMWLLASSLLLFLGIGIIFYVAIEAIIAYYHDLRDKSGYMLFMTPHSVYAIMGSKILAGIITLVAAVLVLGAAAFLDQLLLFHMNSELQIYLSDLLSLFREMAALDLNWLWLIIEVLYMIFEWIGMLTSAFLAITLCMTLMERMKAKGFISFILFWVLNFVYVTVYERIESYVVCSMESDMAGLAVMIIMTVLFTSGCFAAAGYLLNKKLSL